jgi:hypothetical protein
MSRLRSLAVRLLRYLPGGTTPQKQVRVAANPLKALELLRRKRMPKG